VCETRVIQFFYDANFQVLALKPISHPQKDEREKKDISNKFLRWPHTKIGLQ